MIFLYICWSQIPQITSTWINGCAGRMFEPKDLPGWHAVLSHESGRETWSKMIVQVSFANFVKRDFFLANHVGKD